MIGRAAPGPMLGTGRIRVDAARAIAKLRDYQLIDRRTWILEAIRAAVASGARRITVRGDADDVWLTWDGEPWPTEVLPVLFDELVSPEPARDSQHLRLLATAVNTALGLPTAYVDVIAIGADGAGQPSAAGSVTRGGAAHRARYTPDVLAISADADAGTGGATALAGVVAESVERPEHAPAPGMLVHLHRRPGLAVLANLWRGGPPELAIAQAACRDAAVPIEVRGEQLGRDRHDRDLIRVPLGDGLDGFVAIVDPVRTPPGADAGIRFEVAEHGAVLATYTTAIAPLLAASVAMPVRIYLDAPRIPTNASRSEVKREEYPIAAALAAANRAVPAAIEQLAAELAATTPERPERHAALRTAALHLIASQIGGRDWTHQADTLGGALATLAALPLLRNAIGAPRAVNAGWTPGAVHVGAPYPADLEPWLGGVLMLDSVEDPAARLRGDAPIDTSLVRRTARRARKAVRARERYLAHAERDLVVRPRGAPRVTLAVGPSAGMAGTCAAELFTDITGQVCLTPGLGSSELVLVHAGRELDTVVVPSLIRFQAVLACAAVAPQTSYRYAIRDPAFERAITAARAAAIRCAEAIALVRQGLPAPGATVHGAGAVAGGRAAEAEVMRRALVAADDLALALPRTPLMFAEVWPTLDGRWLSLAEVDACGVVGAVAPGAEVRVPRERTVLVLDGLERNWLAARSGPGIARVIHYTAAADTSIDPALDRARALVPLARGGVALAIREPGIAAAIAPSRELGVAGRHVSWFHVGVEAADERERHAVIPCEIQIDDDALVPTGDGRPSFATPRPSRDFGAWERALVRAIARAIVGDATPDLARATGAVSLFDDAGAVLLAAIDDSKDLAELLGADVIARLRAFRVIDQLGFESTRTLDEVATAVEPAIAYITTRPPVPLPGWHPIIADELRARVYGKLIGRAVYRADEAMAARVRGAERAAKLARLRAGPAEVLELPATTPQYAIAGIRARRGVIGPCEGDHMVIHVHVDGRRVGTEEVADALPLVAMVDVADGSLDGDLAALTALARKELVAELVAAAPAIVEAMLAREPRTIVEHPGLARMTRALIMAGSIPSPLRDQLRGAKMFTRIQGGTASIEDATGQHGVLTAGWTQTWLGPPDGAAPSVLDHPILYVPDGSPGTDCRAIVTALATTPVVDRSEAVARLQTKRRIDRGLLVAPTIAEADRALTRRLDQLGPIAERLGAGEIALVDDRRSLLIPYVDGVAAQPIEIDVVPAIRIAVAAPDLASAGGHLTEEAEAGRWGHLQRVASVLVRNVTRGPAGAALPVWVRHRLRNALLARRLEPGDVGTAPIAETTALDWVPWSTVLAQRKQHGDVWFTSAESRAIPLDPTRLAFRFGTVDPAVLAPDQLVDATHDLELDAEARTNMARPRLAELALTEAETTAALGPRVPIESPPARGWVIPLAPGYVGHRGIRASKELFPFEHVDDPCVWPTLTVIDDPQLIPDRTWSKPAADARMAAVVAEVQSMSERALRTIDPPPADAIAARFLVARPEDDGQCTPTGWLWLASPSHVQGWLDGPGAVRVDFANRRELIVPARNRPVRGWLAIREPFWGLATERVNKLVADAYESLLIEASARTTRDDAACHVAIAVLDDRIDPAEVREARFRCFRPSALTAHELKAAFADDESFVVVGPDAPADDRRAIVEDGSALSRLLIRRLGYRAVRDQPTPAAPTAVAPTASASAADQAWHAPRHPLQDLADAIRARLAAIGLGPHVNAIRVIAGRTAPILDLVDGDLTLADHPQLHAIANAHTARSPFAAAAIDAVVAHAVTLLNVRLTEVTDSGEESALAAILASPPA